MSERIPSTYYCDSNEITTGYSFWRIHRQIDGDTCHGALFTPIGALNAAGLTGRCSEGNQVVQLGVRILRWRTNLNEMLLDGLRLSTFLNREV